MYIKNKLNKGSINSIILVLVILLLMIILFISLYPNKYIDSNSKRALKVCKDLIIDYKDKYGIYPKDIEELIKEFNIRYPRDLWNSNLIYIEKYKVLISKGKDKEIDLVNIFSDKNDDNIYYYLENRFGINKSEYIDFNKDSEKNIGDRIKIFFSMDVFYRDNLKLDDFDLFYVKKIIHNKTDEFREFKYKNMHDAFKLINSEITEKSAVIEILSEKIFKYPLSIKINNSSNHKIKNILGDDLSYYQEDIIISFD